MPAKIFASIFISVTLLMERLRVLKSCNAAQWRAQYMCFPDLNGARICRQKNRFFYTGNLRLEPNLISTAMDSHCMRKIISEKRFVGNTNRLRNVNFVNSLFHSAPSASMHQRLTTAMKLRCSVGLPTTASDTAFWGDIKAQQCFSSLSSSQTAQNVSLFPAHHREPLILVDASSIIFRSYYALPELKTDAGVNINALFGFVRFMIKLRKLYSSKYFVIVFDSATSRDSRTLIYADYKLNRESKPKELQQQISLVSSFCKLAGLPSIRYDGFEADDAIASLVAFGVKHTYRTYNSSLAGDGVHQDSSLTNLPEASISITSDKQESANLNELFNETIIVSVDKDLLQLLHHNYYRTIPAPLVSILQPHKSSRVINEETVFQELGVYPHQVADFLAMVGDAADHIPGIPGFGPKTVAELLTKHGDLEKLIQNPSLITPERKRKLFEKNIHLAKMSRKLTEVNAGLPLPNSLVFYEIKEPDFVNFNAFCRNTRLYALASEWLSVFNGFPRPESLEKSKKIVRKAASVRIKKSAKNADSSQALRRVAKQPSQCSVSLETSNKRTSKKNVLKEVPFIWSDSPEVPIKSVLIGASNLKRSSSLAASCSVKNFAALSTPSYPLSAPSKYFCTAASFSPPPSNKKLFLLSPLSMLGLPVREKPRIAFRRYFNSSQLFYSPSPLWKKHYFLQQKETKFPLLFSTLLLHRPSPGASPSSTIKFSKSRSLCFHSTAASNREMLPRNSPLGILNVPPVHMTALLTYSQKAKVGTIATDQILRNASCGGKPRFFSGNSMFDGKVCPRHTDPSPLVSYKETAEQMLSLLHHVASLYDKTEQLVASHARQHPNCSWPVLIASSWIPVKPPSSSTHYAPLNISGLAFYVTFLVEDAYWKNSTKNLEALLKFQDYNHGNVKGFYFYFDMDVLQRNSHVQKILRQCIEVALLRKSNDDKGGMPDSMQWFLHDAKTWFHILETIGIVHPPMDSIVDTSIINWLFNPNSRDQSLRDISIGLEQKEFYLQKLSSEDMNLPEISEPVHKMDEHRVPPEIKNLLAGQFGRYGWGLYTFKEKDKVKMKLKKRSKTSKHLNLAVSTENASTIESATSLESEKNASTASSQECEAEMESIATSSMRISVAGDSATSNDSQSAPPDFFTDLHASSTCEVVEFEHARYDNEKQPYSGVARIPIARIPHTDRMVYLKERCKAITALGKRLLMDLNANPEHKDVWQLLERPLIHALYRVEQRGIRFDVEMLDEAKSEIKEPADFEAEINELAGESVNTRSNRKLSELLYDKLGFIPKQTVSKAGNTLSGRSTSAKALQMLRLQAEEFPKEQKDRLLKLLDTILSQRAVQKLFSTYINKLPRFVHSKTQRIQCRFVQAGTATGRLSCMCPNLQQIPSKSAHSSIVKRAFVPGELRIENNGAGHPIVANSCSDTKKWKFVSIDYRQMELYLLAYLSHDPFLQQALKAEDTFIVMAASLFHCDIGDVTPQMRASAKMTTYGRWGGFYGTANASSE
ncbi:5'-3' exonuclease, N-terminal resolvase family domain-containing protein [Cardiosporidium cionae]|uniref:5'-3' exonuclease, N-terminal resolvase family domain-containing protein n=1 Tax=Cardiosporidium cionae TaxID=476202 RepID=A0ABQ7JD29_9APIC|nr:5'-3' exonuclease, N-terminal resolvase family domain-containing protein [Cardiosporidium cionae]|eukprot:KAF8821948.1 5'-3' exonuclease, N-terminal resolvase family domain-containing protein [Cardiosporidium cionae]